MSGRVFSAPGRALFDTARALYAPLDAPSSGAAASPAAPAAQPWRADHALRRLAALDVASRTNVAPDMENGDATVGDGSPEQQLEPFDPTIAALSEERQNGDEDEDEPDDEEEDEMTAKDVIVAIDDSEEELPEGEGA